MYTSRIFFLEKLRIHKQNRDAKWEEFSVKLRILKAESNRHNTSICKYLDIDKNTRLKHYLYKNMNVVYPNISRLHYNRYPTVYSKSLGISDDLDISETSIIILRLTFCFLWFYTDCTTFFFFRKQQPVVQKTMFCNG